MANERRDRGRRRATRTWHPESVAPAGQAAPVAQITDPALRAILLVKRRALLMEVREIERRCGLDPDAPDDAAA